MLKSFSICVKQCNIKKNMFVSFRNMVEISHNIYIGFAAQPIHSWIVFKNDPHPLKSAILDVSWSLK